MAFRDFTDEKNVILAPFGLTLSDPEAQDFKWGLNYNGDLTMLEKPDFIVTKGDYKFFQQFNKVIRSEASLESNAVRPMLPASQTIDFEIGLVFNFASYRHIGLELEPVQVRENGGRQVFKKLSANQEANLALFRPLDNALYELVTSLADKGLMNWMSGQGRNYFSNYGNNPWQRIMQEDIKLLYKRYYEQLKKHWKALANWPLIFLLLEGKFVNTNIKPVKLSEKPVNLTFRVEMDDRFVNIYLTPVIEDEDLAGGQLLRGFIYMVKNTLHLPRYINDLPVIEVFRKGILKFVKEDLTEVFRTVIAPLRERYPVSLPENLNIQSVNEGPSPQLHLSELNEQSLMLYPKFLYNTSLLEADGQVMEVKEDEVGLKIIERKPGNEKVFFEFIRQLHPRFMQQRNNPYFYLPFSEVMKDNWFLKATQAVQEAGYSVYGLQELKRFRYNTNKPSWEMKAGSGSDWFDLTIKISWGDMVVPLKDIRKAIANRQNTVLLDDGTLGLVPEEWIKQYGLMLKMGEEHHGTVRISKRHFSILDELADQLNNREVLAEIKQKKEKLAHLDTLKTIKSSKEIKAVLRPYQQSGFKWLQTLDELGWGGCLADDMGLGKTLQAITFLQFLKGKYPKSTHLVVCPTSLLYNWQAELEKFCPSLKYHIYYGQSRETRR
ncbi:MAG: SNF2-related protein [Bacteroidota bacterium]